LAAALAFKQDTSVLMLCTNLIKKDLNSSKYDDISIALHSLGQIATPDLARDLTPDVLQLLKHSKAYLRKRAILTLFRLFVMYPESLRVGFPKLQDKLQDPDPSVVAAAVNVICELATRNPKSYLPLAPQLYSLLTTNMNNWMLIKIVKLVLPCSFFFKKKGGEINFKY
jgi:AP-3 complex subunit delta-1